MFTHNFLIFLAVIVTLFQHNFAEGNEEVKEINSLRREKEIRKREVAASQFPESDNPISGQPPLLRPNTKVCTVPIFHNVSLYYYSEVVPGQFRLPLNDCPASRWNMIVLDVTAFQQGTQFDRVGGIWINDQEVLRTTTPEPTSAGINWFIEKDITIYGNYFTSEAAASSDKQTLTGYVSIPNNVDSTYTGIIYLDASISFYLTDAADTDEVKEPEQVGSAEGENYPAQTHLPTVIPLTRAPTTSSDLFSAMQVSGEQALQYNFTLPVKNNENSWISLLADIYASGHGCEEFYYSNLPSVNASDFGFCGGGIYREIQVFIDNAFAGSVLPFPVIYTGGVNPFLWRPLTGIMSFDVPSHRLDLTPFLGYLFDGKQHTIRFSVYGNNVDGFWYLDASLLLIRPGSDQEKKVTDLALGAVTDLPIIVDTGVKLQEKTWKNPAKKSLEDQVDQGDYIAQNEVRQKMIHNLAADQSDKTDITQEISFHFYTFGSRYYRIVGDVIYADGNKIQHSVEGRQQTMNSNSIIGTSLTRTVQNSSCVTESKFINPDGSEFTQSIASFYPLYLEDYYAQDATSFDMQATVVYAYERYERWTNQPAIEDQLTEKLASNLATSYELAWSNRMMSNATYNRTLDHTTVYKESDSAAEVFEIVGRYSNSLVDEKKKRPFIATNQLSNRYFPRVYNYAVDLMTDWKPTFVPDSLLSSSVNENEKDSEKQGGCFYRSLGAKDGSVTSQSMNGTCELPAGMSFCGFDVCGLYNTLPLQQVKRSRPKLNRFPVQEFKSSPRPPLQASLVSDSPLSSAEKTVRFRNRKHRSQRPRAL